MNRVTIKEIVLKAKKEVIRVYVVITVNNLVILQMIVKMKDKKDNMVTIIKIKLDVIIVKDLDILQEIVEINKEIIKIEIIGILSVMNAVMKVIMQEIVIKNNEN